MRSPATDQARDQGTSLPGVGSGFRSSSEVRPARRDLVGRYAGVHYHHVSASVTKLITQSNRKGPADCPDDAGTEDSHGDPSRAAQPEAACHCLPRARRRCDMTTHGSLGGLTRETETSPTDNRPDHKGPADDGRRSPSCPHQSADACGSPSRQSPRR
jgi:hypothetical protein